jgi:2'-5' RNA ligase
VSDGDRLFVAIELTAAARAALASHLVPRSPFPGRPVPPDNWHLTLRFLGTTTTTQLDLVLGALDEGDLGPSFTMSLGALGAFPRGSRATVLWIGVDRGADRLTELAAVAESAAVRAGFAPEDRPFHPHVTLSRVRPHQDVRPLLDAVPPLAVLQRVDEVVVYRSDLGDGPARYEVIERVPVSSR